MVEALVRLAAALRPDVLVLSGDVTQRATAAQFRAARAFVDRLAVPQWLVIPGNHDIPLFNLALRVLAPYARFRRAFGPALEGVIDRPGLLLVALNTTRWWRHVDGSVSAAQVAAVARRLAAARPGQWRVVVTHQPVAVTRAQDRHDLLHGRREALRCWREAGADLVLGGHIHLPFLTPLDDPATPGPARPMWALQAGTAVSRRTRPPAVENSVNLLRCGPAGVGLPDDVLRACEVERWDYRPDRGEFERVEAQHLLRRRDDA
ncbi:metallophosphoesterase [Piscinibacter sakaiensis]|uniref:metallophosphoesterase family protein n=1 Tax=Piscinibacter sakaiensis TaxID=1547922 RepID=UPI00372CA993